MNRPEHTYHRCCIERSPPRRALAGKVIESRMLDQPADSSSRRAASPGAPCPRTTEPLWALRSWLDSWSGIGRVAGGMARPGDDLQLTRYDEKGWRATFYTTG